MGAVVVDTTEDVGEPSLRIDVVETSGLNQCVHEGGAIATSVGAGEQPRLTTEGNSAQGSLGGIVREANTTIIEEARESSPALQHIIHGFGDFRMAREPGALGAHPNFEGFDDGRNLLLATARRCAGGKPLIDRSHSKITSKRLTASSAIGETMTGLLVLAFVAMSARTKNFLLACAQHAASVMGPSARSSSHGDVRVKGGC